jgi:dolichol-phosphate mannosyltransferase
MGSAGHHGPPFTSTVVDMTGVDEEEPVSVAVVMPAWNESEGITEFLSELNAALQGWDPMFIVVDDCSTDGTAEQVHSLASSDIRASVHRNAVNSGHGASTVTGLRLGLETNADVVIAIDGDGQFIGSDVAKVLARLLEGDVDLVEGIRVGRDDPTYRRAVSATTCALVWLRTRKSPTDANTPLRAYRPAVLASLLAAIPPTAVTPNLLVSAMSRRWGLRIAEVPVSSRARRGSVQDGTTWGKSHRQLPSRKFVKFCAKATVDWIKTPFAPLGQTEQGKKAPSER